jgi:K+-sensing histidine kinase KdpD
VPLPRKEFAVLQMLMRARRRGLHRVESGRGIGLGLAIVRAVTKAHGGTISATAPPEGGLEVVVALPSIVATKRFHESAPVPIG